MKFEPIEIYFKATQIYQINNLFYSTVNLKIKIKSVDLNIFEF